MADEAMFDLPQTPLKTGQIYDGVHQTVALIKENEEIYRRYAGTCALALQLAREADNVNVHEKAYARTKIYDSLTKVLDQLNSALAASSAGAGQLKAALAVILSEGDDDSEDAAL